MNSTLTNFNYDDAKNSVNKIESLTDELNRILNTMNGIVEDNVNNPTVWKGQSASSYKQKWDNFRDNNFNKFITAFKNQSVNVSNAIDEYHNWEQQNM